MVNKILMQSLSTDTGLTLEYMLIAAAALLIVLLIILIYSALRQLNKSSTEPLTATPTTVVSQSTAPARNDSAIIAAIIAAITASRSEEGIPQPSAFRVVSFKRADTKWKKQ